MTGAGLAYVPHVRLCRTKSSSATASCCKCDGQAALVVWARCQGERRRTGVRYLRQGLQPTNVYAHW